MAKKTKKEEWGIVISKKDARVIDNPEEGAPLVCQLPTGAKIKILSKPNKKFYGIGVSPSVVGFVHRTDIKVN